MEEITRAGDAARQAGLGPVAAYMNPSQLCMQPGLFDESILADRTDTRAYKINSHPSGLYQNPTHASIAMPKTNYEIGQSTDTNLPTHLAATFPLCGIIADSHGNENCANHQDDEIDTFDHDLVDHCVPTPKNSIKTKESRDSRSHSIHTILLNYFSDIHGRDLKAMCERMGRPELYESSKKMISSDAVLKHANARRKKGCTENRIDALNRLNNLLTRKVDWSNIGVVESPLSCSGLNHPDVLGTRRETHRSVSSIGTVSMGCGGQRSVLDGPISILRLLL